MKFQTNEVMSFVAKDYRDICWDILSSGEIGEDELYNIVTQQECLLALLEIALYPEEYGEELKLSTTAVNLVCTAVILDTIIRTSYPFSSDDERSDYTGDSNCTNDKETNVCNSSFMTSTSDKLHSVPLSVLLMFMAEYSSSETIYRYNYGGITNYCKILYSLFLYDREWTWIFVLSINENFILSQLISLIHHPSVSYLLKLVMCLGCNCNDVILKDKLTRKSICTTLYNEYCLIDPNTVIVKLIDNIEDTKILENELVETENLKVSMTANLLVDIVHQFINKSEIINYFHIGDIKYFDNPINIDNDVTRWLFNKENINDWPICKAYLLSILSAESITKISGCLTMAMQNLDIKSNTNLNLYFVCKIKSCLLLLNSILNCNPIDYINSSPSNPGDNYKSIYNYFLKEIRSYIPRKYRLNILGMSSLKSLARAKIDNKVRIPKVTTVKDPPIRSIEYIVESIIETNINGKNNKIKNRQQYWKVISNVMTPLIQEYMWKYLNYIYTCSLQNKSQVFYIPNHLSSIISIILELLRYIELTLSCPDLTYAGRILFSKNPDTGISLLWDSFNLILFNIHENCCVLRDSILKIIELCITSVKGNIIESKLDLNNTQIIFLYDFLTNSDFISRIEILLEKQQYQKQKWIDDRIEKWDYPKTISLMPTLPPTSSILPPFIPDCVIKIYQELFLLQSNIPWIANLLDPVNAQMKLNVKKDFTKKEVCIYEELTTDKNKKECIKNDENLVSNINKSNISGLDCI
ncbi:hypothetical protein cand_003000 [Cryptosporidium andersoni]|uniref:Uncharacterized protein n=1 Tax=Cryptosporidium andersoni TaxID=117008 RepID=A0A1J4MGV7_9CRYT|nr:hypothetical protein cand_003000 [Cryptosporidium andersoni]